MEVLFDKNFEKELLNELNPQIKLTIKEIITQIEKAQSLTDIPNVKKLKGYKSYYRIKFSSYRIGIELIESSLIFVTYGHRKDFYRYFP